MYELLGICLALASLLTINALVTLVATAAWRALAHRARGWTAQRRADFIFILRILPASMALFTVVALLIPAYAAHEPYQTNENVGGKLALLALLSSCGIALAVWRGLAAWLVTRQLISNWLNHSAQINLKEIAIPVHRLNHSFPVIALVGTFRPRIFIAEYVFAALNEDELAAAIRHEAGHLRARDNFRIAVLRACRDALTLVSCGRALDRAWAAAAEEAADEFAARKGSATALDLAAALVKIARLVPPGARPALPAGTMLIGEQPGSIAARVQRLTQLASQSDSLTEQQWIVPFLSGWAMLAVFIVAVTLTCFNPHLLTLIHQAMERMVAALQ